MQTEATAHDVFEINACHGNTFENSSQTACQFQYILVCLLYYSTWDVHRKKNNLAMSLWVVVFTGWQQRTLRAYWLLCVMHILFFTFPWWLISSLQAVFFCFFSLLSVISQRHYWHTVQNDNYSSSRKTNNAVCRIRCPQSWDQYNIMHSISFQNGVWLIRKKLLRY